ncbi:MAG: ornithine aminomutase, partial [Clostridia bacterium]|nr:ornithine aminomutase [Clostridia bacterium]
MKREDDFNNRHEHLKDLTDEQLEARFWELANKLVDPLLEMGREYTSPAIE